MQVMREIPKGVEVEQAIERNGNVATIRRPEGGYSFIYGEHNKELGADELPNNIQGFFFEGSGFLGYKADDLVAVQKQAPDYRNFFPRFEDEKIPLFYPDLDLNYGPIKTFFIPETLLASFEAYIGYKLFRDFIKTIRAESINKKISRRDLIKSLAKGTLGVWGLSALPFFVAQGTIPIGENKKKMLQAMEKIHPENYFYSLIYRNALMAHKMQFVAEQMHRPHLAGIFGSNHMLLEDQMRRERGERLDFLGKFTPLIKPLVDVQSIYTIRRLDFSGQGWEDGKPIEIPELKELVK